MTLTDYLSRPDAMTASAFAKKIGVSKGRLSQLRNAPWPPELALVAERETNGELDAGDLSPLIAEARATGEAA